MTVGFIVWHLDRDIPGWHERERKRKRERRREESDRRAMGVRERWRGKNKQLNGLYGRVHAWM